MSALRLGADPLARPGRLGSASETGAGRALRHILETQPAAPAAPELSPGNREAMRQEVVQAFSRALDRLSVLAAEAGAWAWGGEGDSLAFLRLMACHVSEPGAEGVDLAAFLREAPDLWPRRGLSVAPGLERVVVPLERGFRLALALQAVLDGLPDAGGKRSRTPAPLFARLDATATGKARVRLAGPCRRFADPDEDYLRGPGRALSDLSREGAVCVAFTRGAEWAELSILA
ncbi:hypothetical protein NNJEOMEG_01939 [Fundidesulfovibrio magnetotacticus]|uniref:Uncharacterized protein n=1 Tax=Fundidesulfovibrio magnetotacticus TaxID=2730080 RepID=A0A6V8LT12_9BACT|nr:hypothetical protein [Fundidesulfovibrio magnetotacticus]GFK94100.1 hypothetical protein NNJEOMEG_01939 [Fundidesulfovibrio magnetotacticus]